MGRIGVRVATRADIPALVAMAEKLHDRHEARFAFHAEDMAAWFAAILGNPAAIVLITGGGFLAGIVSPAPQNAEWLIGFEVFLWAGDGNGRALARAFEEAAQKLGAREVKFSHPVGDDRLPRFFEGMGHEPAELSYTKRI